MISEMDIRKLLLGIQVRTLVLHRLGRLSVRRRGSLRGVAHFGVAFRRARGQRSSAMRRESRRNVERDRSLVETA